MSEEHATITCPNCGSVRPAGIAACSNCGFGRLSPSRVCPHCGQTNAKDAKVCFNCGKGLASRRLLWLWIVLFVVVGLPMGAAGACFVVVGTLSEGSVAGLGIGLLGILVFLGLLGMLIRSARR